VERLDVDVSVYDWVHVDLDRVAPRPPRSAALRFRRRENL
jgi:hypothetical protein